MKGRFILGVLSLLIFTIILSGCSTNKASNDSELEIRLKEKDIKISELEDRIKELESYEDHQSLSMADNLITSTIQVITLIRDKDMGKLKDYIHPTKGVRFTPYPYVDLEKDQVFKADELSTALESPQVYTWGNYDGSGDPIELNFADYYDRFIYDEDFANPQLIGNNVIVGHGNTIENVVEAYPNSRFIEFYFSGFNSEYGGADWRSLKLVFEEQDGNWYLVGIIHGEWTI